MTARVLTNLQLAAMTGGGDPYGLVRAAAIAVDADSRIAWAGAAADLPPAWREWPTQDLGGRLVTPALIDCHTHLVYGGERSGEFEMRLLGRSYADIARAGGGILSTVTATREASEEELAQAALPRLDALIAEGVGTVEIKSGYGLTTGHELKMLRAARRLAGLRPVRVITTFLGAHAVPPEFADRADDYIDLVCAEMLPAVAAQGLADAVDGFCETIAFSPAQIRRVFETAAGLGLAVKLHAEQLSNLGGSALAASFGALSADHLEYLDADGVLALARAGTVAVLLPGAFYCLRETRVPPIPLLREAGVGLAVATDGNPGSSPLFSLLTAMNMACTLFRLTPEEALAGVTREAARALGLAGEVGTVEAGKRAELAVWDVRAPAELAYLIGCNRLHSRIGEGVT